MLLHQVLDLHQHREERYCRNAGFSMHFVGCSMLRNILSSARATLRDRFQEDRSHLSENVQNIIKIEYPRASSEGCSKTEHLSM